MTNDNIDKDMANYEIIIDNIDHKPKTNYEIQSNIKEQVNIIIKVKN